MLRRVSHNHAVVGREWVRSESPVFVGREGSDENIGEFPHVVVMVNMLGDFVGQIDAKIRPFRVVGDSGVVWAFVVCFVNE